MPTFDLRGIMIGKYKYADGVVSYETPVKMGDAMRVELNIATAEGRLYAESRLAEYKKLVTGGSASVGVKYIPQEAQKIMFDMKESTRTVGESNNEVTGLKISANDIAHYVGMGFYAPDVIDGVDKYTAVFVYKTLFGTPGYVYETKGEGIAFQTPTTTGEFLADDSAERNIMEIVEVDTAAEAEAWISACFTAGAGAAAAATN